MVGSLSSRKGPFWLSSPAEEVSGLDKMGGSLRNGRFADFDAATPKAAKTPQEINIQNQIAFRDAQRKSRRTNPDVVLEAFHGWWRD